MPAFRAVLESVGRGGGRPGEPDLHNADWLPRLFFVLDVKNGPAERLPDGGELAVVAAKQSWPTPAAHQQQLESGSSLNEQEQITG